MLSNLSSQLKLTPWYQKMYMLDPSDAHYLLDPSDAHYLLDPSDAHYLLDPSDAHYRPWPLC